MKLVKNEDYVYLEYFIGGKFVNGNGNFLIIYLFDKLNYNLLGKFSEILFLVLFYKLVL